jgi:hypothetical protein
MVARNPNPSSRHRRHGGWPSCAWPVGRRRMGERRREDQGSFTLERKRRAFSRSSEMQRLSTSCAMSWSSFVASWSSFAASAQAAGDRSAACIGRSWSRETGRVGERTVFHFFQEKKTMEESNHGRCACERGGLGACLRKMPIHWRMTVG